MYSSALRGRGGNFLRQPQHKICAIFQGLVIILLTGNTTNFTKWPKSPQVQPIEVMKTCTALILLFLLIPVEIESDPKQDDCSSRPIALKIDTIAYKAAKDLVC